MEGGGREVCMYVRTYTYKGQHCTIQFRLVALFRALHYLCNVQYWPPDAHCH